MILKKILKDFTPPILWNWLRNRIVKYKQNKKGYDERRWWYGQDLIGDNSRFEEIFKSNLSQPIICTLNNEIRDTIKIKANKSIKLNLKELTKNKEILFSFGNKSNSRSTKGDYIINLDSISKIRIKEPLSNRWNNSLVKFDNDINEIEVINNTKDEMYFACPVFFQKFNAQKESYKNIILIVLDQLDQKTFEEVEKKIENLKFINHFFSNSLEYKNCFSAAEWTLPCFSSIFSGKHPSLHGNFDLKISKKIKNVITEDNLLKYLREKGFSIFGISKSKGHHAGYNFQKYFDRLFYFDDALDTTVDDDLNFSKIAINQLETNKDGKNFIYLHYMSSHSPYWKPAINEEINLDHERYGDSFKEYNDAISSYGDTKVEPIMNKEKAKSIIKRQKERIKSLDLMIGQLLSYLEKANLKKNSLVIFTADHGPNHFGEESKPMMNRARLNIPLKIFDYKNKKKQHLQDYVSQIDFYPLIKSLFDEETLENVIPPFGTKRKPVISESIFNNKYKVSIRTTKNTFYLNCKFDQKNFLICLNEIFDVLILDNINGKPIDNDDSLKDFYLNILRGHLGKSQIIKIKND